MIGSRKRTLLGLLVWLAILAALLWLPGHIARGQQEILLNLLIWVGVAQAWNIIGGYGHSNGHRGAESDESVSHHFIASSAGRIVAEDGGRPPSNLIDRPPSRPSKPAFLAVLAVPAPLAL